MLAAHRGMFPISSNGIINSSEDSFEEKESRDYVVGEIEKEVKNMIGLQLDGKRDKSRKPKKKFVRKNNVQYNGKRLQIFSIVNKNGIDLINPETGSGKITKNKESIASRKQVGKQQKNGPRDADIITLSKKKGGKRNVNSTKIANVAGRDYMMEGDEIGKQDDDEYLSGLFSLSNLQGQRDHRLNQTKNSR